MTNHYHISQLFKKSSNIFIIFVKKNREINLCLLRDRLNKKFKSTIYSSVIREGICNYNAFQGTANAELVSN